MLDGARAVDGLFARVTDLGMPAIAMTDHGNLFGAFDFWSKARKHGMKPIIGMEVYITPTPASRAQAVRWNGRREEGDDVVGRAPTPT